MNDKQLGIMTPSKRQQQQCARQHAGQLACLKQEVKFDTHCEEYVHEVKFDTHCECMKHKVQFNTRCESMRTKSSLMKQQAYNYIGQRSGRFPVGPEPQIRQPTASQDVVDVLQEGLKHNLGLVKEEHSGLVGTARLAVQT